MLRRGTLLAGVVGLAVHTGAAAQSGPLAGPAPERAALDQAWREGAQRKVERTLDDAFRTNTTWARDTCYSLATGADPSTHPLGTVLLARHLSPAELAGVAHALDVARFPEERRRLVRSIGPRGTREEDTKAVLALLREFLKDRDLLVRAAAAGAMADLARPEAVADLVESIDRVPAYVNADEIDDREILHRAACGAVHALSGLRPRSVTEVRHWLTETDGGTRVTSPRPPPALGAKPETDVWNGQEFALAPGFDVYVRIAGLKSLPASGAVNWTGIVTQAESGADAARRALERIAGGPVHPPVPRLYLCDAREFSARAGVTFFQGVTKSNEIVIKLDPPLALAGTMAHEYVHWVHENLYHDQPRWLSEGLACSFSQSPRASVWKHRTPDGELKKMLDRGVFTELFNWNSSGSSDAKEGSRYALSHLAIDFLRFGEFSVADERLAFFMGRISRRQAATRALAETYGIDAKSMDRAALDWLAKGAD